MNKESYKREIRMNGESLFGSFLLFSGWGPGIAEFLESQNIHLTLLILGLIGLLLILDDVLFDSRAFNGLGKFLRECNKG